MPTYDYECGKCGHTFEVFQSMSEEPKKRCPRCRGKVRRLLGTGAGVIFKGSGFYQTDYRSEGYRAAAKAEKEGSSPPAEKPKASDAASTRTSTKGDAGSSSG